MKLKDRILNEFKEGLLKHDESLLSSGMFYVYVPEEYRTSKMNQELSKIGIAIRSVFIEEKNRIDEQKRFLESAKQQFVERESNRRSVMRSLESNKDDILTLRKSGSSYQSIATKYGVSRTTMTKFIKMYI